MCFEGIIPVQTCPNLSFAAFCSNLKDQDCWLSLFPILVWSSLSFLVVPRLDFQAPT